ncbi:MAG: hypothetical protein ACKVQJ_11895 [Pyrinomonadaceae bacterium]
MKNSVNILIAFLILVVIGCSCPDKLRELANNGRTPPPKPSTENTSTPPVSSTSGEYDVTKDKFDKIKTGMKKPEVENIMGGKGTEYYSGTGGGVSFSSVKWVGAKYATVFVSFRNDKVTSKTQVGLK